MSCWVLVKYLKHFLWRSPRKLDGVFILHYFKWQIALTAERTLFDYFATPHSVTLLIMKQCEWNAGIYKYINTVAKIYFRSWRDLREACRNSKLSLCRFRMWRRFYTSAAHFYLVTKMRLRRFSRMFFIALFVILRHETPQMNDFFLFFPEIPMLFLMSRQLAA